MRDNIDLRIVKTKNSIKDATKNLIIAMPYEKIKIKDLCDKALISRKTFYLHYSSIDDVVNEIQDEISSTYYDTIKNFDHVKDVDKLIDAFFRFSDKQDKFYEIIHTNSDFNYLHSRSNSKLLKKANKHFKSIEKFSKYGQAIILSFINGSLLGIYKQWILDKKSIPLNEIIDLSTTLVKAGLDKILS